MKKKIIKLALIGNTNAGKSTLINSLVGEQISIINKKINTTQDLILGVKNLEEVQIIFYDTPGSNFLKKSNLLQKKFKINIWKAIDSVDLILFLVDATKYSFKDISIDLKKISEVNKPIILVFNKIDLIKNEKILPFIDEIQKLDLIENFFNISSKYKKNLDTLLDYFIYKSKASEWIYNNDEITNKDDIFITNECTRNAILKFLHQEIPYKLEIKNILFKYLKNKDLKIKQSIEINNLRYQPIILGKKGEIIKKIRETSQSEIKKILNCKVHLYLQLNIKKND